MARATSSWLRRVLALGALCATVAGASERSELLVAQGEVAYYAGRIEEARGHFADALAADPSDDAARAWLDTLARRVPGALAGAKPAERATRWWDLEVGTGVEYDSNPRLDPSNPRQDAGFLFTLAGHVDPVRDDRTLVRLDYDFYQVLYASTDEFDERSNRFHATLARAVVPGVWLGVQGGYDHLTLNGHAYLQEPWAMPYLSVLEGDFGSTQMLFRYGQQYYLGSPFHTATLDRNGPVDTIGANQLFFLLDRRLTLTLGFAYEQESPDKSSGDDFARHTTEGIVGLRWPAWWRTLLELDYVYKSDDYTHPQSVTNFTERRQDGGNYVAAILRRPILPGLDALVSYYATVNASNIPQYDYNRHVFSVEVRYAF
jgi:hypothetical protein